MKPDQKPIIDVHRSSGTFLSTPSTAEYLGFLDQYVETEFLISWKLQFE